MGRECHFGFDYSVRSWPLLCWCPSHDLSHQADWCYQFKRQAACAVWNVAFHWGSNSHYDLCLASQKERLNRRSWAFSSFTIAKELLKESLIGFLRRRLPGFHLHPCMHSASERLLIIRRSTLDWSLISLLYHWSVWRRAGSSDGHPFNTNSALTRWHRPCCFLKRQEEKMRRMNEIGINVRDSGIGKPQLSMQLTVLH